MHHDLRSIGALARESGLPISALRFYDAAGVLRPAFVDPATGYRWYTTDQCDQARLVARLRRVEMPVADICDVLAARHDPASAQALLDRHLERLENDLTAARNHLAEARALITDPPATRFTVDAAELRAGFRAVRHAVATDPGRPALTGVLLDFDGATLRLVACDRIRLAVSTVAVRQPAGPAQRVIVPEAFCAGLPSLPDDVPVVLRRDLAQVGTHHSRPIDGQYPDYEQLLRTSAGPRVTVAADELVARFTVPTSGAARPATGGDARRVEARGSRAEAPRTLTRPTEKGAPDVVVVRLDADGVTVVGPDDPQGVAFDRSLLLDAARARPAHRLTLALDGARGALSVADADRPDDVSLLMPIRLHN